MKRNNPIVYFAIWVVGSCLLQNVVAERDTNITKLLQDPDFIKFHLAMLAFEEVEEWRQSKVAEIYADASVDELIRATRWINTAEPVADHRSCQFTVDQWSASIDLQAMWNQMQTMKTPTFVWNDTCDKAMLALHSYHTTGIEGNTLTLTETMQVINNQPLFAEFSPDGDYLSRRTRNSVLEVKNVHLILAALKFSGPPVSADRMPQFTKSMLVEMNSAILGISSSVRTTR